jgi:hypothetical protein
MRGFDNYQRNTGARHPIQPEVVDTGSKRAVGKNPLTDESEQLWQGMSVLLNGFFCLTHFSTGVISVGTPPVSRIYL